MLWRYAGSLARRRGRHTGEWLDAAGAAMRLGASLGLQDGMPTKPTKTPLVLFKACGMTAAVTRASELAQRRWQPDGG